MRPRWAVFRLLCSCVHSRAGFYLSLSKDFLMNLKPVVLRVAGAEVSLYLIDMSDSFVERLRRRGSLLLRSFLILLMRRMLRCLVLIR